MSRSGSPPPERFPTLTEVVDLSQIQAQRPVVREGLVPADAPRPIPIVMPVPIATPIPEPVNEEQIARRVLADLQTQIDLMLEYRLREVLGPLLVRAADSLVQDARQELASTLHDLVARAVSRELERHRTR